MKRMPAFLILTIITLVSAVLLAITDDVTRGPIAAASLGEADAARQAVLTSAESFAPVEEVPQGLDAFYEGLAGGARVGHVATVTVQGFAGPVEVTLGVDANNAITGLNVGGSAFAETAGLGDKVKQPEFTDQFVGKALPVTLNGDVDAITGATVTSRAVVDAVNTVGGALGIEGSAAPQEEPAQEPASDAAADPRLAAYPGAEAFVNGSASYDVQIGGQTVGKVAMVTVQGFEGPIEVTVGMDGQGVLTGISVGGAGFAETPGLGTKAQEPAFTDQFMGKTAPLKLGQDIDAVASATVTSTAVVKAVNTAAQLMAGEDAQAAAPQEQAPEAAAPVAADPGLAVVYPQADAYVSLPAPQGADALYEARAGGSVVGHVVQVTRQGRNGPVQVTVGLDLNRTLTGISVGGEGFAETSDLGGKAAEPAFTGQFVGKTAPLALGQDVDVISGATITSSAVVDAVNAAAELAQALTAAQEADAADQEAALVKAVYPAAEDFVSLPTPEGLIALYEAQVGGSAVGHVAVVSQEGYKGPVEVTVGMDLAGVLTGVSVGGEGFAETPGIGTKAQEPAFTDSFVGKSAPVKLGGNVDAISGATVTGSAVQNAVNIAAQAMGAGIEFTLVDTQSSATH